MFSQRPPRGSGWAHELKQDGYRLQIHIRNGRVRLYTMNGADWSKRYPLIVRDAARIKGSAIQVWLDSNGVADFEALHSRSNDGRATALAFDLLMFDGEDLRLKPYVERKAASRKLLRGDRGIQYVEHTEKLFTAACSWGLRGSCRRNSTRPIVRGNQKPGSKSKIRTRPLQLGR
jgi:bifunctional non-homologous end joining protein LigD